MQTTLKGILGLAGIMAVALAGSLQAQPPAARPYSTSGDHNGAATIRAVLSPVPVYPPDGVVPEQWSERTVFRAHDAPDWILAFDPNSPDGRPRSTAPRKIIRLPSRGNLRAQMRCSVQKVGEEYHYQYTVTNTSPNSVLISRVVVETGQFVTRDPAKGEESADPYVLTPPRWFGFPFLIAPARPSIRWTAAADGSLGRGTIGSEFRLRSSQRPGLTIAHLQSDDVGVEADHVVPEAVRQELNRVRNIDTDSLLVFTLAPLFGPHVTDREIAAHYHVAISRLSHAGALRNGSPFVRLLLDSLAAYMDEDGSPSNHEMTPGERGRYQIPGAIKAESAQETEVLAAMKVAFAR